MYVVSIDVGIVNLAIVFCELTDDNQFQLVQIISCETVDTRIMSHVNVKIDACKLGHTKTATDRLSHLIQERRNLFDQCSHVLIERQPIMGHTDVEQVLYTIFREKAELISPNSMHKFFNISGYTYDGRKNMTVHIADQILPIESFPGYHVLDRKHDIADAICILLFWSSMKRNEFLLENINARTYYKKNEYEHDDEDRNALGDNKSVIIFANKLNKYRYNKK